MPGSTKAMLQRRVEILRAQVTDLNKELGIVVEKLRNTVTELIEAQSALKAAVEAETAQADLIPGVVNKMLTGESIGVVGSLESGSAMVNGLTSGQTRRGIRPGTIKAQVMEILSAHPGGLIALDILRLLNREREQPLDRTSLSPQLSRLGQAGHIKRRGALWYIPRDDEAPDMTDEVD